MKIKLILLLLLLISQNAIGQRSVDDIVETAMKLASEQKYPEALEEIAKAIGMEPNRARHYLARANIYRSAKDISNLRKDVERAIQLEPDDEFTLMTASRFLGTGFREDCERIASFTTAFLARFPNSAAAYGQRSSSKVCLGDLVGAFNDVSQAIELAPEDATYRNNRASLISRMGDNEKSLELYQALIDDLKRKILKEKGPYPDGKNQGELMTTYLSRARIHERMGNAELALADLSNAVTVKADDVTLRQRAAAYTKAGRLADAAEDVSKMIEIARLSIKNRAGQVPPDFEVFLRSILSRHLEDRSDLYSRLGRYTEALADLQECRQLDPAAKERIEKKIVDVKRKQSENTPKPS